MAANRVLSIQELLNPPFGGHSRKRYDMVRLDTAMTPPTPITSKDRSARRRLDNFGQKYGALSACIFLFILNCFFTPHFLSYRTLGINLQQMSSVTIVAIGMTLVIGTG